MFATPRRRDDSAYRRRSDLRQTEDRSSRAFPDDGGRFCLPKLASPWLDYMMAGLLEQIMIARRRRAESLPLRVSRLPSIRVQVMRGSLPNGGFR